MKNATKHAEKLRALCRAAFKEGKPESPATMEPLVALVRGAMSFDVSDTKADDAMKAINAEFVDLNELRVATDLEIQELLGVRYPAIEKRVVMITQGLNYIFEKEHTLSLDRLKTLSKRDARVFMRELPDIHPYVEAYVMLFAFEAPCFPIDDSTLAFLKEEDVLEEEASLEDGQKFLEHNLKAEEVRDLYLCLRRMVFDESARKKKGRA